MIRFCKVCDTFPLQRQESLAKGLESRFIDDSIINRDIKKIGKLFTFREPEKIFETLTGEPSLINLIFKAHKKIKEYFSSSELFIEVFQDPSIPEYKELSISISTELPPKEALEMLESFDKDWWLNMSMEYSPNLCIRMEYR